MQLSALTCLLTLTSLSATIVAHPAARTDSHGIHLQKRDWPPWRRTLQDQEGSANLDPTTLGLLGMAALSWFGNLEIHLDVGLNENNHRVEQRASIYLPLLGMQNNPHVRLDMMYVGVRVFPGEVPPNLMTDNGRSVQQEFLSDIIEGRREGTFAVVGPSNDDSPPAYVVRYHIETEGVQVPATIPSVKSGDAQKADLPVLGLEDQVTYAFTWLLSAAAATFLGIKLLTG